MNSFVAELYAIEGSRRYSVPVTCMLAPSISPLFPMRCARIPSACQTTRNSLLVVEYAMSAVASHQEPSAEIWLSGPIAPVVDTMRARTTAPTAND